MNNLGFILRARTRYFGGTLLNILSFLDHISVSNHDLIDLEGKNFPVEGKSVAIYVSYKTLIGDVWEDQLFKALMDLNFEIIKIANGSETMGDLIGRRNRGYDLAAVRDVTRRFSGTPVEILILNSSVAWGTGFQEIISECRNLTVLNQERIIAMTESLQRIRHAQSFFFYARGNSVNFLTASYKSMRNWRSKRATVTFGEQRLTGNILGTKSELWFLLPYHDLLALALTLPKIDSQVLLANKFNINLNPTQHLWNAISTGEKKFVKRNLIFHNPAKLDHAPKSILVALSNEIK